jgi:hypothetical protein
VVAKMDLKIAKTENKMEILCRRWCRKEMFEAKRKMSDMEFERLFDSR